MTHPEPLLALSQQTMAWLRRGGRPTRSGWRGRAQLQWHSFWFERHLALTRHLALPPPIARDPVFILGLWRSGTTFLHNLLGVCPALLSPTTWQCMHPALYRLHPAPAPSAPVLRPMDGLMVDALSPQEDEFALLALGVPSVYRGFLDPRRLPELSQWLHPEAWSSTEPAAWFELWQTFLAGMLDGQSGRLLLKSPPHTFRIQALMQAFPQASYVWIVRDPVEVWHSNRKMWLSMFRRYALWDWDETILEAFLHTAFCCARQCLSLAVAHLPPASLAVVDFTELTQSPVDAIRALNEQLQFAPWAEIAALIMATAQQRTAYRQDTYGAMEVPAAVQTTIDALRTVQHGALASHAPRLR